MTKVDSHQSDGNKEERSEGEVLTSQTDNTLRGASLSFKIVVGIYLCLGFLSIVSSISHALKGSLYVGWPVHFFVIGVGLSRRSRPWRTFGVVFGILMALCCINGLIVQLTQGSYSTLLRIWAEMAVGAEWPTSLASSVVVLLSGFLVFSAWSVLVLTRPRVRAMFQTRTNRRFSNLAALCVLLVTLTLSRETGGLDINLAATKFGHHTSMIKTGPSLVELGAQAPLVIDIQGLETESILVITEIDVKPVTTPFGGTTRKRSWKWESYTGATFVSRAKSRFPQAQQVQVVVSRLDIEGAYWLPLIKTGTASFKVTTQGLDGLDGYSRSIEGELSFDRKGLSSAHDMRRDIGAKVARFGIKDVMQSATAEVAQEGQ